MDTRDPMERLSSAYRVEVAEDTKTRHIAEMGVALKAAPPAPVPTGFALRRRLAGALAAVFVVVAPVGMAVAAEDSVPGDVLYPMKQVTERVRAVFDDEVEATHRVEEVERLVFLRAPRAAITRAVERAEAATSELVDRSSLGSRLESARQRLQEQDEEQRREREAAESQSRDQEQVDRQGEEERQQGNEPDPDRKGESGEGSSNSGAGSQQSGQGGATSTTTTPPQFGGSGDGAGDRSSGDAAPGPSTPPDPEAGGGEPLGGSSGSPEPERAGTPEGPGRGTGSTGSSSTTVP
ncbi:MAG: hypothetical protein WCC01_04610 [Acidimicrobiia bacterium]